MTAIWIEITGRPGEGTVAEGRDVSAGDVLAVEPGTARRLLALGTARLVEPPVAAPVDRPAAEVRKRTR